MGRAQHIGKTSGLELEQRNVLDAGAETNHPNFAIVNNITYGWVTVASLNETKVYRQDNPGSPSSVPVLATAIRMSSIEPRGIMRSPDPNVRSKRTRRHR